MRTFFLLIVALAFHAWPANAAMLGEHAPDFSVQDIDGHAQSLAQYKGKIVVMEWFNPGCPFVHKHYDSGNMQALQRYAADKGVVWLSVDSSAEGKEGFMTPDQTHAKIAEWHAQPTAFILDPQGTLGHMFGATATPHMFVIDQKGALIYAGAIDNKPTADKADIPAAHNYVRSAIDALLAGKPVKTASAHVYGCSVKYKD